MNKLTLYPHLPKLHLNLPNIIKVAAATGHTLNFNYECVIPIEWLYYVRSIVMEELGADYRVCFRALSFNRAIKVYEGTPNAEENLRDYLKKVNTSWHNWDISINLEGDAPDDWKLVYHFGVSKPNNIAKNIW